MARAACDGLSSRGYPFARKALAAAYGTTEGSRLSHRRLSQRCERSALAAGSAAPPGASSTVSLPTLEHMGALDDAGLLVPVGVRRRDGRGPTIWRVRFASSVDIAAPPAEVFAVYADVERWPEWTPTVTSVERLDSGPLRLGARARIRQPRLPTTVWEVTEYVDGVRFTWVARAPGAITIGTHEVAAGPAGSAATASIEQRGPLGSLIGLLTRRLTARYLEQETQGLRARCEGPRA
jgi:Polyketide cyclase / dehydrase and lipid transport